MQLFRSNNLRYLFIHGLYRAGNLVTIEPWAYFIPELIDLWKADRKHDEYLNYQEIEKYKDFSGLRNEEDFVIIRLLFRFSLVNFVLKITY